MYKAIIFDVMGNDNGVRDGVLAAVDFTKSNIEYKIILVGDQEQIKKYCSENEQIEIVHNPNTTSKSNGDLMNAHKENNSMNEALKLLKKGDGLAVLSSGDSGKYLSSAMMIVKRIEGISRPAFMSIIPTIKENKKFILLDEGANLNNSEEYLVQWAKLGASFSKSVLKVKNPKVWDRKSVV